MSRSGDESDTRSIAAATGSAEHLSAPATHLPRTRARPGLAGLRAHATRASARRSATEGHEAAGLAPEYSATGGALE